MQGFYGLDCIDEGEQLSDMVCGEDLMEALSDLQSSIFVKSATHSKAALN